MTTTNDTVVRQQLDTFTVAQLFRLLRYAGIKPGDAGREASKRGIGIKEHLIGKVMDGAAVMATNTDAAGQVRQWVEAANLHAPGTRKADADADADDAATAAATTAAEVPPTADAPKAANGRGAVKSAAEALADALAALGASQPALLDEAKVRAIAADVVAQTPTKEVTRELVIKVGEVPTYTLPGRQHRRFTTLVKLCNARKRDGARPNVWLHGPAGTGKTTAAMRAAKALGLPFYIQPAVIEPFQLLGYRDASGNVVSTPFMDAWKGGGILIASEADSYSEAAVLAINPALANGHCGFPDGVAKRHPDFVFIADANTTGHGATRDHAGRTRQDGAFLSRFAFFEWALDEECERAEAGNVEWVTLVQRCRAAAQEQGGELSITPRATYDGADLLQQGFSRAEVIEWTLRQGAPDDVWGPIAKKVGL